MDIRTYFQKIREAESKITEPFPVVISHDTGDGGKAGARTEVPRAVAAKMLVEGTAHPAQPAEAKEFREQQAEAHRVAVEQAKAAQIQMTLVPAAQVERMKGQPQPAKG
jgi:hypothetical protein